MGVDSSFFSTQDLGRLVKNMKMGLFLVCLVRVVASRQAQQVSELMAEVVMNYVIRSVVGLHGHGGGVQYHVQ